MSAQLSKLCFDALVQREVPENVRTSVFAWSETMLQVLWVVGGTLGIVLPLNPYVGFPVCAVVLVWTVAMAARQRRRATPTAPTESETCLMAAPSPRPLAIPAGPAVLDVLPALEAALTGRSPVLPYAADAPPPAVPSHDRPPRRPTCPTVSRSRSARPARPAVPSGRC